jgi:hypothetical protein
MKNISAIDTDGHVLERKVDIRKHLEPPWNRRSTPLAPEDQPWDNNMFDSFEMAVAWQGLSQVQHWHLEHIRRHRDLSDEVKEKILYKNARDFLDFEGEGFSERAPRELLIRSDP